eukprot:TRINITY_DN3181_c5_g1_i1.p1 TRINITY_DN3181_c5_g1~~TRINITY_DN3181_c5_g1_i1.p1  ORF type:complete len:166 (+),score=27.50 TRINITY_DN3181_c5_g1_i1:357-854(+)
MSLRLRLFKQRQRFAAAHFTIYDNSVERLHGHNYTVEATFHSDVKNLKGGLIVPFDVPKEALIKVCDSMHERVLLPTMSEHVKINKLGEQFEVHVEVGSVKKFYSFPSEDVVLVPCNNISTENMAVVVAAALTENLPDSITSSASMVSVTVSEGSGSEVTYDCAL